MAWNSSDSLRFNFNPKLLPGQVRLLVGSSTAPWLEYASTTLSCQWTLYVQWFKVIRACWAISIVQDSPLRWYRHPACKTTQNWILSFFTALYNQCCLVVSLSNRSLLLIDFLLNRNSVLIYYSMKVWS